MVLNRAMRRISDADDWKPGADAFRFTVMTYADHNLLPIEDTQSTNKVTPFPQLSHYTAISSEAKSTCVCMWLYQENLQECSCVIQIGFQTCIYV